MKPYDEAMLLMRAVVILLAVNTGIGLSLLMIVLRQ